MECEDCDQDFVVPPYPFLFGSNGTNGTELSGNRTTFVGPGILKDWTFYIENLTHWVLIITVINLIGNVTILCLIKFSSTFRKPANYLIGNLSAASLMYMTTVIVHRLERLEGLWSYGPTTCHIIPVLHKIPTSVISLTLIAITLDRSRIIRNPFDVQRISPVGRIIGIWILSVVIVLPYGIAKRFDESRPEHYKCVKVPLWGNLMYNVLYGLIAVAIIHVIPAVVLLTDVFKMLTTMKFLSLWPKQVWKNEDRRVILMRNSCVYAFIFIICWLPIGICRFFLDLPRGVLPPSVTSTVQEFWEFLRLMGYTYVALHPLLLFILSHDLRQRVSLCFA